MEQTSRAGSGQNFSALQQLQITVVPLEAESLWYSQIKEGLSKLQLKLATMEITGEISISMRKHGIDLKYCNMSTITRYCNILYNLCSKQINWCLFLQHFNEIKLNGRVVRKVENNNPKTFNNVKVWATKAQYGFPPADAYIQELRYENLGNTQMVDKEKF